ncbi:hypothetical protein DN052_02245 [Acidithiobacillus ferrooxidans]|uniref:Uncharacterized protein n=1 Tax=Acidithiobacillus ferrooxidans TaxID=920 RepID=A0A2W1K5F6_ACIFR|nr:hypothetical protein DN052_02245 [Acidithiobacillus ferrooxidans]
MENTHQNARIRCDHCRFRTCWRHAGQRPDARRG